MGITLCLYDEKGRQIWFGGIELHATSNLHTNETACLSQRLVLRATYFDISYRQQTFRYQLKEKKQKSSWWSWLCQTDDSMSSRMAWFIASLNFLGFGNGQLAPNEVNQRLLKSYVEDNQQFTNQLPWCIYLLDKVLNLPANGVLNEFRRVWAVRFETLMPRDTKYGVGVRPTSDAFNPPSWLNCAK